MEEQIGVVDGVHTSVREYRADVFMEFLRNAERMMELLHQQRLFVGKLVRISGVDGGEMAGAHLVLTAVKFADASCVIHVVEETTVFHLPLRMALENLRFFLELYHGNSLMHLGC